MKRFFGYMMAWAAAVAVACAPTPNEGPNNNNPNEGGGAGIYGEGPYTIEVDKNTVEADGIDLVNFRVLDAAGNNLCEGSDSKHVYIQNVTEGLSLGRKVISFSSLINGTFEFTGTFKGVATENSVTVTAQNRAKYEKYKQMICVYDLTGTWCGPCAMMAGSFEKVKKSIWNDQMILLAVHGDGIGDDPFAIPQGSSTLGDVMMGAFGGAGFPTIIYDLNKVETGTASEGEVIENLRSQIVEYPSTCGVKIAKTSFAGGKVEIEAAMTSTEDGEYDLGYALLADGLAYDGGTEEDGIYDDVVVTVSSNFMKMQKDSKFSVKAGVEQTKKWNIEGLGNANPDKLRVVVFALKEAYGMTIVDNANVCAVGSSADYMLNE